MTTPSDVLRQAIDYEISNLNVSLPASIVSYDYTKQKASVQPLIKNKFSETDIRSLPIVTDVPVIFPKGGTFHMHWPLSAGDSVLLVFSQRSLDLWLSTGGEVVPDDQRKFSLSDAIAIPGLIPFTSNSPAEDNENFVIKMGNGKLKMSPDGTYCFHGVTEELMGIISELFSALLATTVLTGIGPQPFVNIGTYTSLKTRFETLKGDC